MKPISVAKVGVLPAESSRHYYTPGFFAYPVPEFEVAYYQQPSKTSLISRLAMARNGHHMIWHHDWRYWGTYKRNHPLPVVYYIVDSTQTEGRYLQRREKATELDILMVDYDHLNRFADLGLPTYQCSYAVNEHVYCDRKLDKDIDIGFYMRDGWNADLPGGKDRMRLLDLLKGICERRGYIMDPELHIGPDYPPMLNRCKVLMNLNRPPYANEVPIGRCQRIFEGMASRTCVLTDPADVPGEYKVPGIHYVEFNSFEEIEGILAQLLDHSKWRYYADNGYELIQKHHIWRHRASELRANILKASPWVREQIGEDQ